MPRAPLFATLLLGCGACAAAAQLPQENPRPASQAAAETQPSTEEIRRELNAIAIELRATREQHAAAEQQRAARNAPPPLWVGWILQGGLLAVAAFSLMAAWRAFYLTHRPRVIIRNIVIPSLETGGTLEFNDGSLWVANIGETKAVVLKIWHTLKCYERLPMNNPANDALVDDAETVVLATGQVKKIDLEFLKIDSLEDYRAVVKDEVGRKKTLYLIGYVKYKDGLGNLRKTYFCRRYDPVKKRFKIVRDSDYEYAD